MDQSHLTLYSNHIDNSQLFLAFRLHSSQMNHQQETNIICVVVSIDRGISFDCRQIHKRIFPSSLSINSHFNLWNFVNSIYRWCLVWRTCTSSYGNCILGGWKERGETNQLRNVNRAWETPTDYNSKYWKYIFITRDIEYFRAILHAYNILYSSYYTFAVSIIIIHLSVHFFLKRNLLKRFRHQSLNGVILIEILLFFRRIFPIAIVRAADKEKKKKCAQ